MERQSLSRGVRKKAAKWALKSGRKDREGILGKGTHRDPHKASMLNSRNKRLRFLWLKHGARCGEGGRSRWLRSSVEPRVKDSTCWMEVWAFADWEAIGDLETHTWPDWSGALSSASDDSREIFHMLPQESRWEQCKPRAVGLEKGRWVGSFSRSTWQKWMCWM